LEAFLLMPAAVAPAASIWRASIATPSAVVAAGAIDCLRWMTHEVN
jgi:hypothetical protein